MEDRRRSKRLTALAVGILWCTIATPGLVGALLISYSEPVYCAAPTDAGGSVYDIGELSWSVVPPGPRCTWTNRPGGIDRTQGPSPVWSMWVLILLVLGSLGMRALCRSIRVPGEQHHKFSSGLR